MDSQIRLIQIGKWEGNIVSILALISPYSIEITVRINIGGKLIIKDPNYDYYSAVKEGGCILIPEYEPDFERCIFGDDLNNEDERSPDCTISNLTPNE